MHSIEQLMGYSDMIWLSIWSESEEWSLLYEVNYETQPRQYRNVVVSKKMTRKNEVMR